MQTEEIALTKPNQSTGEFLSSEPRYDGIAEHAVTETQEKALSIAPKTEWIRSKRIGDREVYYVDGIHYRDVLDSAFGKGGWAIRPLHSHVEPGTMNTRNGERRIATIYLHGQLWAEGRFISESIGEDIYYLDNPNDSYATGWEKAKSNLLMRCCKELGIFRQLWDKDYLDKIRGNVSVDEEPEAPHATPQPSTGAATIAEIAQMRKRSGELIGGTNSRGAWKLMKVKFSDGVEAKIFSTSDVYKEAVRLQSTGGPVVYDVSQADRYEERELVSVGPEGQATSGSGDLPF